VPNQLDFPSAADTLNSIRNSDVDQFFIIGARSNLWMQTMKLSRIIPVIFWVVTFSFAALPVPGAVIFTNLVSFNTSGSNGTSPYAGLIQGKDGNFYGTTSAGGPGGGGTLFRMTPLGTLTNLVSFNTNNGAEPIAGLIQGLDGNFYGTTYIGGSNNFGTVFRVTTNGMLTTLVTFAYTNGAWPIAGLIQGLDGNFYGTTSIGGTNLGGTVFQVVTNGVFATLVSFNISGNAGNSPYSGLVQGSDGSLYGTTYQGGTNGHGTIFKLTTNGTFTSLYSFTGTNDGGNPYAGLVPGPDGNFYGTTFFGGTNGYGTVFKYATNGTLTTMVSFGNTNGAYPQGGILQASDGNLYGTTSAGGAYTNQSGQGYGTVFKLGTNGILTTLVSFDGTNGAAPEGGLIQSADGNFYGTTASGGANGYGTVFRLGVIVPPPGFRMVTKAGTTLTLAWNATVGQSYQMLYKTNLNQAVWSNLNNSVTATNPIMTTSDAIGPDRQRFYRILLLP
jgi:uncharacterized repeat protein (TIGR03803 family)